MFPSHHPSLPVFCKALGEECDRLIAHKRDVESGVSLPPERKPIEWPIVPSEYNSFDPFEAHFLLEEGFTSPAKATRSAKKRIAKKVVTAKRRMEKASRRRRSS